MGLLAFGGGGVLLVVDSVTLETVDAVVAVFRRREGDLLVVSFRPCLPLLAFADFPASARLGRLAKRRPISARSRGDDDSLLSSSSCGETSEKVVVVVAVAVVAVKSWQLPPARS